MKNIRFTKLNLGCGDDIKKGYVNLDSIKLPGVDVVSDLNKKLPFKDNTFEEVYCSHVLEHLDSIDSPLEEIWRITKNGGRVIIKVPIFPSIYAVTDPTHKQFFAYGTFEYFSPNARLNYYSKARFNILKRKIIFPVYLFPLTFIVNLDRAFQTLYSKLFSFLIPAKVLYAELRVAK